MVSKEKSGQVVDGFEVWAGAMVVQVAAALLCKLAGAYLRHTIVHITYSLDAIWAASGPTWPGEHLEQLGDRGAHIRRIDCRWHLPTAAHHPPAHPQLANSQITHFQWVEDINNVIASFEELLLLTVSLDSIFWFPSTMPELEKYASVPQKIYISWWRYWRNIFAVLKTNNFPAQIMFTEFT